MPRVVSPSVNVIVPVAVAAPGAVTFWTATSRVMHAPAAIGHSLRVTVPFAGPSAVGLKASVAMQLPGPAKLRQSSNEKTNGALIPVPAAGQIG